MGADRRQHLPRRTLRGAAVPHAARARIRGLPDADPRPVPMLQRDPRRGRRVRDPRIQLRPGDREGHEGREAILRERETVTDERPRGNDSFPFYFASWYKKSPYFDGTVEAGGTS